MTSTLRPRRTPLEGARPSRLRRPSNDDVRVNPFSAPFFGTPLCFFGGSSRRRSRTTNANLDPFPLPSLVTAMSPPIRRTSRMLITSPSPVPPSRRVRVLFTCSNAVNSDARSREERPTPVSVTSKSRRTCARSSSSFDARCFPPSSRCFERVEVSRFRTSGARSGILGSSSPREPNDRRDPRLVHFVKRRSSSDGDERSSPAHPSIAPRPRFPASPPRVAVVAYSTSSVSSSSSSARTRSTTLPRSGVNFTALLMRLVTTCRSRASSPTSPHGTESSME